jgi:predicted pyridoxine 5'-phosphate oxidase superfamily flavin-nucleotide-binding protein
MAYSFGSLVFTPLVRALQEKYGSRRQYARIEEGSSLSDRLGPTEIEFIEDRDTFYMATIGSTGWPYIQHRGGPKGFLKVIDDHTIAFDDFRGNKQYISTGNIATNDRVALILVDYPHQARLKLLGRVEIFEGDKAGDEAKQWIERLRDRGYRAVVERAYVIKVEAFDWNCQQHITPRYTREEIQEVLDSFEHRLEELQRTKGEVS